MYLPRFASEEEMQHLLDPFLNKSLYPSIPLPLHSHSIPIGTKMLMYHYQRLNF